MTAPAFRFEVASMPTVRAREPAVEPAAEVQPAFLPRRESRQYCATASERFDAVEAQLTSVAPVCRAELEVCRSTGEAMVRADTAFTVDVRELVYPGGPEDSIPVEGKWIYVFREEKLAAEARAVGPGIWDGATIDGSKRRPWRSNRGVPVDPGPKGSRHDYFFLLSPVRLTASAIKDLENARVLEMAAVGCASDSFGKTVLAPDPLQWAAVPRAAHPHPRGVAVRRVPGRVPLHRAGAEGVDRWGRQGRRRGRAEAGRAGQVARGARPWARGGAAARG